jgi:hypothetical protein
MASKTISLGRLIALLVLGPTLLLAALLQTESSAHAAGAIDVMQQFLDAFNSEDNGAIQALVTSDFAVQNNADCQTPCEGLSELGVLIGLHMRIQVLSAEESGDVVTGRLLATSNSFNLVAPGITRVFADARLVIRDGKVALLVLNLDLTDPQSAELANQFRTTRGPQGGLIGLQNALVNAVNRGDLAAIRSLITDDFVVTGNVGCATPCQGDAFIQVFLTIRLHIAVLSTKIDGTTVTSRVSAESTHFDLIVPGVERVLADVTMRTRGDRASALDIQLDTSDSLSALLAADLKQTVAAPPAPAAPAQPAAAPQPSLPATGDGGLLAGRDSANDHLGLLALTAGIFALLSSLTVLGLLRRSRG